MERVIEPPIVPDASTGAVVFRPRSSAHVTLLVVAGALAAIAWLMLIRAGHRGHPPGVWPAFLMWNVMMVAMMLPPTLPWFSLLVVPGADHPYRLPMLFATGYFAVWTLYAAVAAGLQHSLHDAGWLDGTLALSPRAGGVLLMSTGLFQLTPLKHACLRRCRSPVGYLLSHWRRDRTWALRVGLAHGAHCVGCCWALMALGFVAGVMEIAAMTVIAAVVCIEKLAPGGASWSRGMGVALVLLGAAVIAAG